MFSAPLRLVPSWMVRFFLFLHDVASSLYIAFKALQVALSSLFKLKCGPSPLPLIAQPSSSCTSVPMGARSAEASAQAQTWRSLLLFLSSFLLPTHVLPRYRGGSASVGSLEAFFFLQRWRGLVGTGALHFDTHLGSSMVAP